MYSPPDGTELSALRARQLDDTFFTSDPHAYFRGRIASLLRPRQIHEPGEVLSPLRDEFMGLLGDLGQTIAAPTERPHVLQVAVDAFMLRHHLSEALLRLTHGLLLPASSEGHSTWVAVTLGPTSMRNVIDEVTGVLDQNESDLEALYADLWISDASSVAESIRHSAIVTYSQWFTFAMNLLLSRDPDATAAHNKMKHGLAARPGDDTLAMFSTTVPDVPGEGDATIPLSAVTGNDVVPIFEGLTVEYLTRARAKGGVTPALESTQLNLEPARLLAEATIIAHTYGAMFAVAARKHFGPREPIPGRHLPPYPAFPLGGPLPEHLRGETTSAVRVPLTTASDGSTPKSMWVHADGTRQSFQVLGEAIRATVVDG